MHQKFEALAQDCAENPTSWTVIFQRAKRINPVAVVDSLPPVDYRTREVVSLHHEGIPTIAFADALLIGTYHLDHGTRLQRPDHP